MTLMKRTLNSVLFYWKEDRLKSLRSAQTVFPLSYSITIRTHLNLLSKFTFFSPLLLWNNSRVLLLQYVFVNNIRRQLSNFNLIFLTYFSNRSILSMLFLLSSIKLLFLHKISTRTTYY